MARPTDDPIVWSSDTNYPAGSDAWNATPTKVAPSAGQEAAGWEPEDMPPAQHLNHVLNNLGEWLEYVRTRPVGIGAANLRSVTVGAAMFGVAHDPTGRVIVTGGASKTLYSSADGGDSWTSRALPAGLGASATCERIIHDGTEFIYVGFNSGNWIATSTNGVTWTDRSPAGSNGVSGVAYDGSGVYVAGGSGGKLWSSTDAHTWTARLNDGGALTYFSDVAWGDGLFVGVGQSGMIQTSPDGTAWTARTADSSYSGILQGVSYDGSVFAIAGASSEIQTSPDGITWTTSTSSPTWTATGDLEYLHNEGVWCMTTDLGPFLTSDPAGDWMLVESATDASDILNGGQIAEGGGGVLIANDDATDQLSMGWRSIPGA